MSWLGHGADQAVAGYIFHRNARAGYHDGNAEDSLVACDVFWENG